MRLRDFRPWSAGSTVCLVLLGFTAGICLAQAPKSEQPAAKAAAKRPSIYDKTPMPRSSSPGLRAGQRRTSACS